MIVPEYWAEARMQVRERRRSITVRRFGWSDESQQAAQAHAEARVQTAMEAIRSGQTLPRREQRTAYGVEGIPIREQVVTRSAPDVITRNSYGALCLNSPDVLFADVDLETPPTGCVMPTLLSLTCSIGTIGLLVMNSRPWWMAILATLAALVLINGIVLLFKRRRFKAEGGAEGRAMRRLEQFSRQHPDWTMRIYRTPAGLRVLVMHAVFDPQEDAVAGFFKALHADALYATMCRLQNCFRARLTPKPWRIGLQQRIRPRVAAWSPEQATRPDRLAWIAEYEHRSEAYAACGYVRTLGDATHSHPRAEHVRSVHDQYTRAEYRLPLA